MHKQATFLFLQATKPTPIVSTIHTRQVHTGNKRHHTTPVLAVCVAVAYADDTILVRSAPQRNEYIYEDEGAKTVLTGFEGKHRHTHWQKMALLR